MIGHVGSSRDRSFLCLLAIYLGHAVLFHVFDVAPTIHTKPVSLSIARPALAVVQPRTEPANDTAYQAEQQPSLSDANDIFSQPLRHEVFARSSQSFWDSALDPMTKLPKINFDLLFLLTRIHHIENIIATLALSTPTWGVICGCAIFLLTYTDRDNTLLVKK